MKPFLSKALRPGQQQILQKTNYILDNLLCGGYPGHQDVKIQEKLENILVYELNVTHFISLMQNDEIFGQLNDYRGKFSHVQYLNFQIPDCSIAKNEDVIEFIDKSMIPLVSDHHNTLYIHCRGGNGRSSTITSILISRMFKISWKDALEYVLQCYRTRKVVKCWCLPETSVQFQQIQELSYSNRESNYITNVKVSNLDKDKEKNFDKERMTFEEWKQLYLNRNKFLEL